MKRNLLVLFTCVMILSCFLGKTLVTAKGEERNPSCSRYYTTIEVQKGDSLWTIAETYRANSGLTSKEYIDEVKAINGLASDRILAGRALTIVYYAEQPLIP